MQPAMHKISEDSCGHALHESNFATQGEVLSDDIWRKPGNLMALNKEEEQKVREIIKTVEHIKFFGGASLAFFKGIAIWSVGVAAAITAWKWLILGAIQ